MASMYGKDAAYMKEQNIFVDPPKYNQNITTTRTFVTEKQVEVVDEEPVECTPMMCIHPMGLLRWFQLLMFFILQWLVQITCGGDACTMIMNVFGYTALGQIFVLIIFLWQSILCAIILLLFSLNAHRAFPGLVGAIEKLYALVGIPLMLIAGALGTWMAVLTNDPEVNYQGRGRHHIKGQWIAAAVIEFLMVFLYMFDFWLQRKENYPYGIKDYTSEAVYFTQRTPRFSDRHPQYKEVAQTIQYEEGPQTVTQKTVTTRTTRDDNYYNSPTSLI